MNPAREVLPPPRFEDMPRRIDRDRRAGPQAKPISVSIETTTPILGGAPKMRSIDDVDIIRVPTIRGHLRFWWRALQTQADLSPAELYAEEARLWGKAADSDGAGRSMVEISVKMTTRIGVVDPVTRATDGGGAYALWPARQPRRGPGEAAPSRSARVAFMLNVTVSSHAADLTAVQEAIRAWILFGGYGSRTRRGVGSLTVIGPDRKDWLPQDDMEDEDGEQLKTSLQGLFPPLAGSASYPLLGGSTLLVGALEPKEAERAWHTALGWLRQFRQDDYGRVPRSRPKPPGQSYWPEGDKLRLLAPGTGGHPSRYTDKTPAWPRADFGLPILGQFQGSGEPKDFTLTWFDRIENKQRDRMASPVIVKALPTMLGYRPCVLWLSRSYPPGDVVAVDTGTKLSYPRFPAAFGSAGTPTDQKEGIALKFPLSRKSSVKEAFLEWVGKKPGVIQVTP